MTPSTADHSLMAVAAAGSGSDAASVERKMAVSPRPVVTAGVRSPHRYTPSRRSTSLDCTGRGDSRISYMWSLVAGGGPTSVVRPYYTFGTNRSFSDAAVAALEGGRRCLLAKSRRHRSGCDLCSCRPLDGELDRNLAAQYCTALALGGSAFSMRSSCASVRKFRTYGKPDAGGLCFRLWRRPIFPVRPPRKVIGRMTRWSLTYRILDPKACCAGRRPRGRSRASGAAGGKLASPRRSGRWQLNLVFIVEVDRTGRSAVKQGSNLCSSGSGPRCRCRTKRAYSRILLRCGSAACGSVDYPNWPIRPGFYARSWSGCHPMSP